MSKRNGRTTRLLDERRSQRLTQADVQLATGIQMSRLSLYERGYARPSKAQRAALAQFYRVSAAVLFAEVSR